MRVISTHFLLKIDFHAQQSVVCCSQGRSLVSLLHLYLRYLPNAQSHPCFGCPSASFSMLLGVEVEDKVCEKQALSILISLPVDRSGNRNTPCMQLVKRQFPWDTPPFCTEQKVVLLYYWTHTHTHVYRSLSDLRVKLPLSQALTPNRCIKTVMYVCKRLCIIACACI